MTEPLIVAPGRIALITVDGKPGGSIRITEDARWELKPYIRDFGYPRGHQVVPMPPVAEYMACGICWAAVLPSLLNSHVLWHEGRR